MSQGAGKKRNYGRKRFLKCRKTDMYVHSCLQWYFNKVYICLIICGRVYKNMLFILKFCTK